VLIVLWVVLILGGSVVVAFFGGLLAALGGLLPQPLKALWELIVGLGGLAVFVYMLVRLCFSMPMTLEDRHVRLLESWKLTRHNFWTLLGVFLLTAILILVLILLVCSILAVALIVAMAAGLPRSSFLEAMSSILHTDMSSLAAYFSPTSLIAAVLNAIIVSVGIAILTAPVAEAYLAYSPTQGGEANTVH
jgi:membrane-anchored glycerophosphoryl diester phosphodiesterase (GDPDase)